MYYKKKLVLVIGIIFLLLFQISTDEDIAASRFEDNEVEYHPRQSRSTLV